MLRAKIYIMDIDYNTIVGLMMPYIETWLFEKDNFLYGAISRIISKEGRPTRFSNRLVSLVPNKNDVVASVLPYFNKVIVEYLNDLMSDSNIIARIVSMKIDKVERKNQSMLRIEIDLDNIDYEATVEQIIPKVIQQLSEKEDNSVKVAHLLQSMNDLPGKAAKAAIGVIPKDQRNDLMATILMEYREELKSTMNGLITQNNIKAEICNVKVESIKKSMGD